MHLKNKITLFHTWRHHDTFLFVTGTFLQYLTIQSYLPQRLLQHLMKLPSRHWGNRPTFLMPLSVICCNRSVPSLIPFRSSQKHTSTSLKVCCLHIWQVKHQNILMATAENSSTNVRTFAYSCLFKGKKEFKTFSKQYRKTSLKKKIQDMVKEFSHKRFFI